MRTTWRGRFGERRQFVEVVVPLAVPVVLGGGANARGIGERVCASADIEWEGLPVNGLPYENRDGRRKVHAHAVEDAFGMGFEVVVDSKTDLCHGWFFS